MTTNPEPGTDNDKNPFLVSLGARVRENRARQGMTRRQLASIAAISERHLASLESGVGNVSVLFLQQVAQALKCSLTELIGDVTAASPEGLLLRELLEGCDEDTLRRVRLQVGGMLGKGGIASSRNAKIALVGLRGAGKSTLGRRLAESLGFPFVELSREIEAFAGCRIHEIQSLYGASAYRRYQQRALQDTIERYPAMVMATPGGIVSDAGAFDRLLSHTSTVWLKADPEDHMNRVVEQGDTRPMAASREAMKDLRKILKGREAFYSRADYKLDTSLGSLDDAFEALRGIVSGVVSRLD